MLCVFFLLLQSEERGTGLLERITSDHRSLLQLQLYELSDRDSGMSQFLFIYGFEDHVFIFLGGRPVPRKVHKPSVPAEALHSA